MQQTCEPCAVKCNNVLSHLKSGTCCAGQQQRHGAAGV